MPANRETIWVSLSIMETWPVNCYSIEGERHPFKYHRTIGTTLNTLIRAGFRILAVEEFAPSAEQITQTPELEEELERPMMLLVSAQR